MSDFLKIVTEAIPVLNRVQDNVRSALPARSDLTEGFLVENATVPGNVNHGLGRAAIGAIVVKQTPTDPVLVTGTSSTTVTLTCASSGTASIWVF